MLLAGLVGVCYVCTHYLRGAITWPGPAISHQLTLAAGLLGLAAGVAYGHTPHSYTLPVGVVFYAGLLAVSGAIVVQTGGVGSPNPARLHDNRPANRRAGLARPTRRCGLW